MKASDISFFRGFLPASILSLSTVSLIIGCTERSVSADQDAQASPQATRSVEDGTGDSSHDQLPNFVIIMADDLGWGDVGYNGGPYSVTPNIDEMAKSGIIFDRFYAAAPVCSPTRGSLLTGRHPFRYGVFYANAGHLPDEEITIAELLKDRGYATGFFGKWHLGTLTRNVKDSVRGGRPAYNDDYSVPWDQGFDVVFATESIIPTFDPMRKPATGARRTWWDAIAKTEDSVPYGTTYWNETGNPVEVADAQDSTELIVDQAIPFIKEAANRKAPFLAVLWPHAPHTPVVASNNDRDSIPSEDSYTQHYFGSIKAMDREIGELRRFLDEVGLAHNTLIWFMSDNGPERFYRGDGPGLAGPLRGSKRDLYEGGIRVPGVLEWPAGIPNPRRVPDPVVTSDILPTLIELAGGELSADRPLDGVSLARFLQAPESNDLPLRSIAFESVKRLALVGSRYKIIHAPEDASILGRYSKPLPLDAPLDYQLFDLIEDPYETTDISADNAEATSEMAASLMEWRKSTLRSRAGEDYQ